MKVPVLLNLSLPKVLLPHKQALLKPQLIPAYIEDEGSFPLRFLLLHPKYLHFPLGKKISPLLTQNVFLVQELL